MIMGVDEDENVFFLHEENYSFELFLVLNKVTDSQRDEPDLRYFLRNFDLEWVYF